MNPDANHPAPKRLDEFLVSERHFSSRSRARDAILRGHVRIDGEPATRPGRTVPRGSTVTIDDPANRYVSRAALKLIKGLDAFAIDPSGKVALDLGASTGGFTQVLLERGASRVIAIDVGHGQMRPTLAADPRVTSLEGVNARDLDSPLIGNFVLEVLVCDVSFISLRLALPAALGLAAPGAKAVFLVKPQFEVGREGVGKGGIVDEAAGHEAATAISDWLAMVDGWRVLGLEPSPIQGGDGNREYLLGAVKAR